MKCTYIFIVVLLFSLSQTKAQIQLATFFEDANTFLSKHVKNGKVDYLSIKQDPSLNFLIQQIQTADLSEADTVTQQAFLINAYNLSALKQVINSLSVESAFKGMQLSLEPSITVASKEYTFNGLTNQLRLLNTNPLFHFALINTAFSFSTLSNFAYTSTNLNQQLHKQTERVVNHPKFIEGSEKIKLPNFLKRFRKDFVENTHWDSKYANQYLIKFINQFRASPIGFNTIINFKSPNDKSLKNFIPQLVLDTLQFKTNREFKPYAPRALLPSGSGEIKIFNSLKRTFNLRPDETIKYRRPWSFADHIVQARFGISPILNIGFRVEYQLSNYLKSSEKPVSFFNIYKSVKISSPSDYINTNVISSERGLKAIGPKFWLSPFKQNPDLVIESTILFPAITGLKEFDDRFYFDGSLSVETKLNYFTYLNNNWLLNTNIGLHIADIGKNINEYEFKNTLILPAKLSLHYLPDDHIGFYSTFDVHFNGGKTKVVNHGDSLFKNRGFSSVNRIGLLIRCSPSIEINTAYFIMFTGANQAKLKWDYSDEIWNEESWTLASNRIGTGFDLNFRFVF